MIINIEPRGCESIARGEKRVRRKSTVEVRQHRRPMEEMHKYALILTLRRLNICQLAYWSWKEAHNVYNLDNIIIKL